MSRTKLTKEKRKHVFKRGNPLGICNCNHCRTARRRTHGNGCSQIIKLKHKYRTSWKTGKEFVKGAYPA